MASFQSVIDSAYNEIAWEKLSSIRGLLGEEMHVDIRLLTTRAVELRSRERVLSRVSAAILPRSTCTKDPHAHWEMIEGLKSRYRVEECSFNTIFIAWPAGAQKQVDSRRLLGRCILGVII